jgi:endonuclease/exonuclease/phosphatase family metal-dependent hydrolase
MRQLVAIVFAGLAASTVAPPRVADGAQAVAVTDPCPSRAPLTGVSAITWYAGPVDDAAALDEWCRGVGPPLVVEAPPRNEPASPPALADLVVISWNAHLAEGRLDALVADLRAGRLTGDFQRAGRISTPEQPVRHFVLLVQELYRRGADVPAFRSNVRSAFAIRARDANAPDARDFARTLGLSMVYIPSMRNGADLLEDRGNAILSTEPLLDHFALELPFERQRRVAVGASIRVSTAKGISRLNLIDVHLEPLSSPASLWIFKNPRRRQVAAILDLLARPRFEHGSGTVGTVLGGDFNTIQGGADEDAYVQARSWSQSLAVEDRRNTHYMGRLDYLFFRLAPAWTATTERLNDQFGSDHYPVLGRFLPASEEHAASQ